MQNIPVNYFITSKRIAKSRQGKEEAADGRDEEAYGMQKIE